MENGSDINAKDAQGFTPLHVASKSGNIDVCVLLLENQADPNVQGYRNKTPLHKANDPKIVRVLLKYGANPCTKVTDKLPAGPGLYSCFDRFVDRNPDCGRVLLDERITTNGQDLDSNDLLIVFDLGLFQPELKGRVGYKNSDEVAALSQLVSLKLYNLLVHPISAAMLELKWQCIKKLYWMRFCHFALFVLMLTYLVYQHKDLWGHYERILCEKEDLKSNVSLNEMCRNHTYHPNGYFSSVLEELDDSRITNFMLIYILVLINTLWMIIREVMEFYYSSYYGSKEDILELILLSCTTLYLIGIWALPRLVTLHLMVWSVFLAWIELNLLLERFSSIGIYIRMLTNVSTKLVGLILVYSPVLMAFTLGFNLLLDYKQTFASPFLKILAMMHGEFEYSTFLFIEEDTYQLDMDNIITTQLLFGLLVIFVSVVIGNLLIAVTMSEIESLTKEGEAIALKTKVLQISALDDIYISEPSITDCLPNWLKCIKLLIQNDTRLFEVLNPNFETNDMAYNTTVEKSNPVCEDFKFQKSTQICVRPFAPSSNQFENRLDGNPCYRIWHDIRSVLVSSIHGQDTPMGKNSDHVLFAEYSVYLYDQRKRTSSSPTNFTLPRSCVDKALNLLKDRKESKPKLVISPAFPSEQERQESLIGNSTSQEASRYHACCRKNADMTPIQIKELIDSIISQLQELSQNITTN